MPGSTDGCEPGGPCHALRRPEVLEALLSSESGLTAGEAADRLKQHGANEIREVKGTPLILKFLENFYHLFAIML